MKLIIKVLVSGFVFTALVLFGFHIFLQHGMTKTMREIVLPRLKSETGIEADVSDLSINVLKGAIVIKDVEVKNPEGFLLETLASTDLIRIDVKLLSLLTSEPVFIQNIEVNDILVNVVRNQDGEINIAKLHEDFSQAELFDREDRNEGTLPDAEERSTTDVDSKQISELVIETLQCNASVRYVDLKTSQLDLGFDVELIGSNLSTLRDDDTPWGQVNIIGSLENQHSDFVTDLQIELAPITDLNELSFDLYGTILGIDPKFMKNLYSLFGLRSEPFTLDPSVKCRDGWYENSYLSLNLPDTGFNEGMSEKLGVRGNIGSLDFTVPLGGSFWQPNANIKESFMQAIVNEDALRLGSIIKRRKLDEDAIPEPVADALTRALSKEVDEVGESETLQKLIKDLLIEDSAEEDSSALTSDVIVDILGEQVNEVGQSEALKQILKELLDDESSNTNATATLSPELLVEILVEQMDDEDEGEALKNDIKTLSNWLFGE